MDSAAQPEAESFICPTDMIKSESQTAPSVSAPSTAGDAPQSSDEPPKKKRKSWGQVLPKPTTNLPPRKRAKTEEEKAQRKYERVQRNRHAAHMSRMRKQDEMENLKFENARLEQDNTALESENARLKEELARISQGAAPSEPSLARSDFTFTHRGSTADSNTPPSLDPHSSPSEPSIDIESVDSPPAPMFPLDDAPANKTGATHSAALCSQQWTPVSRPSSILAT